jgi:metal-responsive CopG/Arc/MetJ family transcriptional regulator
MERTSAASSSPPFEDHMKYIAAHIPDDTMTKLSAVASGLKMSRSALIRMALESYLDRPHRLVQADQAQQPAHAPMTTEG